MKKINVRSYCQIELNYYYFIVHLFKKMNELLYVI